MAIKTCFLSPLALLQTTMSSLSASLCLFLSCNYCELYQAKILEYVNTCQQQQVLPT